MSTYNRVEFSTRTFFVHLYSPSFFCGISACLMIENRIPYDFHTRLLGYPQQLIQLFSATPFRCPSAFLFELSKIPKIVDIISIPTWIVGFAARRQPKGCHAQISKRRNQTTQTRVLRGRGRSFSVPFKALQKKRILRWHIDEGKKILQMLALH